MIEDALRLARLGWFVLPCHVPLTKPGWSCSCEAWRRQKDPEFECSSPGKHPRTAHGLDDASIDEKQIATWWERWPQANIGINCGKSGLLVLDADTYKDSYQGHDLDEETVTAISGGGGAHLFYRLRPDDKFGNSTKGLPSGIDIRGRGGYVVAAPSLHSSGNRYQWEDGYAPWEMDVQEIPAKLREILEACHVRKVHSVLFDVERKYIEYASLYGKAALESEFDRVSTAPNGTRNNVLNTAAYTIGQLVAGGELDHDYAFSRLLEAASKAGLAEPEAERTADSGMSAGMEHPRSSKPLDEPIDSIDDVLSLEQCPDPADLFAAEIKHQREDTYPYAVKDGVLKVFVRGKGDDGEFQPIADFNAWISQEIVREDGKKLYVVDGQGLRGKAFSARIDAEVFGTGQQLVSIMEASAGALNKVWAGKAAHLGPAIKTLSTNVSLIQHFSRTGWGENGFLFPGHDRDGEQIELYKQLRYGLQPGANLPNGLDALKALLDAMPAEQSTVIVAYMLSAPLFRKLGVGDRYGLFISGKSGSLKTSFCQVAMSLYGDFNNDDVLIKWGKVGSTGNALPEVCAQAADLPILIDNYKPNTGDKQEFTQFIHMVMEGGTKLRLSRTINLRGNTSLNTWPLITGEDVPQEDGATLARMLTIYFAKQIGMNYALSQSQAKVRHLSAVGSEWIRYIETSSGFDVTHFDDLLAQWAAKLQISQDAVLNPLRIANNLALNQLVWEIAVQHPVIGPVLAPYSEAHRRGLENLVGSMSEQTGESTESSRWLQMIQALLTSGEATLLEVDGNHNEIRRSRMIGYQDAGGVYLVPNLVDKLIRQHYGQNALNGVSNQTIYKQLRDAKLVAKIGDKTTIATRINGDLNRYLFLIPNVFEAWLNDDSRNL